LGSRALDILIVLISAPNEIVSKKDLMSWVWPDRSRGQAVRATMRLSSAPFLRTRIFPAA
jgi:DNA-binding winged helix-turn-helix (wHTH) protein